MVGLGDLPSELAIVIFGFLEPFPEALHRCALVSRAFVHPCQSLLLSNTLVDWREKKIENEPPLCRDIETFAHQLESSPHFNLIIRRLTFQPYPGSGWYDVDTSLFIKVLNQLRNLQALTLRFLTFSKQASFDVGTLRPYAERHQLDKLEVELVNFQDFGTFNNIMSTFAKIRVFDIERSFSPLGSQLPDPDAYAFETSTTSPASHVYPLNTSELRICTSGQNSLFRCLSRLIHASQTNPEVLMLRTRSSRTLDMSCKALIDQLGPTLRIFMVDFLDDGYNPSRNSAVEVDFPAIEMSQWSSLQGICIYFGESFFNSAFEWSGNLYVLDIASRCGSVKHTSIIVVNVNDPEADWAERHQTVDNLELGFPEWKKLDKALAKLQGLQLIRMVFMEHKDPRIKKLKEYLLSQRDLAMVRNGLLQFPLIGEGNEWAYESGYRVVC